jgi:RimJ/RimL family protein N-acetyltransferase
LEEGPVERLEPASLCLIGVAMIPTLRTPRLTLRAWRRDDREPFAAVNADAEVMRFVRDGHPLDRRASDELVDAIEAHWRAHGYGLWAVEVSDGGAFAGFAGLAIPSFLPEVLPAVEVGWRLGRAHWGQGYATEAATAALGHALDDAGLREVISVIHPDNQRSIRVAAKLGMRPGRPRLHPETRVKLAVYSTTATPPSDLG